MSQLFYYPDCGCHARAERWLGTLLHNKDIGCAINVMVFLEALRQDYGEALIPRLNPQVGTPFSTIIGHIQPTTSYPLREAIKEIRTVTDVTDLLDEITEGLRHGITIQNRNLRKGSKPGKDACTIVKLNRSVGCGHTVILSLEGRTLYTVDPQLETQEEIRQMAQKGEPRKIIRERNDPKIYDSWITNDIVSVSYIMGKVVKGSDPGAPMLHNPQITEAMETEGAAASPSESDESPAHGDMPSEIYTGDIPLESHAQPNPSPTDLTKRGKVYALMAHGAIAYYPSVKKPLWNKRTGDETGKHYEIECLTIPKNIVLLTLTSVGISLSFNRSDGSQHNRTRVGLPYEATMGRFRYERWGAKKGMSHYQFPNFILRKEHSPDYKTATGIYQRTGPERKDMRSVLDLESYGDDKKPVFYYDTDLRLIQSGEAGSHLQTLKEVIETIKRDSASQGGKQKIYLFCCFCLSGIAPSSRESVVRCCEPSSIDVELPGKIIASKKKRPKKKSRKRKNTRKKPKKN